MGIRRGKGWEGVFAGGWDRRMFAQGISYELGSFPIVVVFWNKGAPAGWGFDVVGYP